MDKFEGVGGGFGYVVNGRDVTYVYPDFSTAIVGTWADGSMKSGREARIKAYRYL